MGVSSCFLLHGDSAANRRQSSTTMLALLILGAVASAQKDDFGFGGAPRRHLPLLQTSPSLFGSSPTGLPPRRTVILRESRCWLGRSQFLSLPPLRSSSLRARAPTFASSLLLPSLRSGSLARA